MCQAIEIHGDMFRLPEIRRDVFRKDGANRERDPATRQLPSFAAARTRQKAPRPAHFSS
ncbi:MULTISPECIES: hypothetical protein [unclassified Caulobacter]|jgi:hypothetical protein|uniref:hypothetical protein n=1 Tax=unclassified Caulobacter TaxID=2648921 RepID=UPI00143DE373|nr:MULTISPECIES: hypothetical protein [unclassified Caulobacter]